MALTPRQVSAFLHFGGVIDRTEQAIALRIGALAAQGKGADISKEIKSLISDNKPQTIDARQRPAFPVGARVERRKKQK